MFVDGATYGGYSTSVRWTLSSLFGRSFTSSRLHTRCTRPPDTESTQSHNTPETIRPFLSYSQVGNIELSQKQAIYFQNLHPNKEHSLKSNIPSSYSDSLPDRFNCWSCPRPGADLHRLLRFGRLRPSSWRGGGWNVGGNFALVPNQQVHAQAGSKGAWRRRVGFLLWCASQVSLINLTLLKSQKFIVWKNENFISYYLVNNGNLL